MLSRKAVLKRTPMKRRKPKARPHRHDKALLNACRGQPCYLGVPGICLGDRGRDTVVPAHSNQQKHGKGMGIKSKDEFTVPACMACHAWIDQSSAPKDEKFAAWDAAFYRWERERSTILGIIHPD